MLQHSCTPEGNTPTGDCFYCLYQLIKAFKGQQLKRIVISVPQTKGGSSRSLGVGGVLGTVTDMMLSLAQISFHLSLSSSVQEIMLLLSFGERGS